MELATVTKSVSMDKMVRYSGTSEYNKIHSDEGSGKQSGLGGALAQGGQLVGYLNEMMLRTLGPGYVSGGEIAVTFIKPVRSGDTVTTRGTQKESKTEAGRTRIDFEIWLENQNGDKCTVGTASGFAP